MTVYRIYIKVVLWLLVNCPNSCLKLVCAEMCPQEEEEPSDDAHPKQHVSSQRTLRLKSPRSVSSDESLHLDLSEIPVVSPLEEEKVLQPHTMTMANLHEASRYGFISLYV